MNVPIDRGIIEKQTQIVQICGYLAIDLSIGFNPAPVQG